MPSEPFDWNVVVIGKWNPAILTPAGIACRLFGLDPGTPIDVMVNVDGLEPPKVRHEGLEVQVTSQRLIISPATCTTEDLDRARQIAVRALDELPETPFSAAGFNLRFRMTAPSDDLLETLNGQIDGPLADADFTVEHREIRRTISFAEGTINLSLVSTPGTGDETDVVVRLNFDRSARACQELRTWLTIPIDQIRDVVDRITPILHLQLQEHENEWHLEAV